jgi:hypothetical protein
MSNKKKKPLTIEAKIMLASVIVEIVKWLIDRILGG